MDMFDDDDTLMYEPALTAAVIMTGDDEEAEKAALEVRRHADSWSASRQLFMSSCLLVSHVGLSFAICNVYDLIQAFFQALQMYSWGFALIQYFSTCNVCA